MYVCASVHWSTTQNMHQVKSVLFSWCLGVSHVEVRVTYNVHVLLRKRTNVNESLQKLANDVRTVKETYK